MTTYADFKAKSILVKDVNETAIAPGFLTMKDGTRTLSVTPSSLSCDGSFTISNATLGTTTGVTVSSTDNSTNLATTAFVKAQSYTTGSLSAYATISSLADYAKLAIAQTWTALQTFSGIATNLWNGTSATSAMTIGSNLTTGSLTLGTSTSSTTLNGNTTISQLASPITPNYAYPVSSGKIGYYTFVQGTTVIVAGDFLTRNLATLSVPPGVWGIMGHTTISGTNTANTIYGLVCITSVSNTYNTTHMSHNQPRGTNYSTDINVSGIVTNSTASNVNWYLVGVMGVGGDYTNNYLYIVRLA